LQKKRSKNKIALTGHLKDKNIKTGRSFIKKLINKGCEKEHPLKKQVNIRKK
jgi:hypothetical protein